jgi:outer membrane protein OmpA-like peptidoglycan-associated protein
MKTRILVTFLWSTVVALSGFAQQAQPASGAPPQAQGGTICNEPLRPPTGNDFWNGDEPNVVNLFGHGLTTKKYVNGQVGPIQDCINELHDVTASNANAIRESDARAQQGIQLAAAKTKEADEHATDAGNRASAAQQTASQPMTRLSSAEQVVANPERYKAGAQTEIYFDPGQSVLSKKAKNALDEMAVRLKDQRSYVVEVRGYSAGHGQAAIANSQKIADSVVRYLVLNHRIPVHRIYMVGMGSASAAGEGGTGGKRVRGGRVDVSVLDNDLVSSAQP